MTQTLTLTPKLQIHQPAPVAPRLSLTRVLWYKVLKWIEKATLQALIKSSMRVLSVFFLGCLIFAPSFALGYLTAALRWNNFRVPIFCAALALMLNIKRVWRWQRRPRAHGNQHTYHGVPVPELADFLKETLAFKRDEAIKRLGLSQGQYAKIGSELEERGVLIRGEANARVLRAISREHLVTQLRDNFPLVWDPDREIWVEKDGQFNRWVLSNEFKQRKMDAEVEKKQRKLERLEEKIEEAEEEAASPLSRLFAHSSPQLAN